MSTIVVKCRDVCCKLSWRFFCRPLPAVPFGLRQQWEVSGSNRPLPLCESLGLCESLCCLKYTPARNYCKINPENSRRLFGGWQKGGFPKGWFWRMFPRNENRNEGTFGCCPATKTGKGTFACSPRKKTRTRVHSPKPPFYETALLSPSELWLSEIRCWKSFPANFDAAGKLFPDFPAARNAIPAKVWAFSGKENGCWRIGPAFGNAAGFSPPRPPQPSWVLLINSENIISCNWNEIFQANNSQTTFPCNSLNHKRIRVM